MSAQDGRRSGRDRARTGPDGTRRPGRTTRTRPAALPSADVGRIVELEVGAPAHGGHCVARFEGRVVFVRHSLPGERVQVRLTEAAPGASFWRGDTVEVLQASADRVESPWPEAGPGGAGGGELAHVALPAQRAWKAAVVAEQLARLAEIEWAVEVEAAPGDDERGGLAYRTRIELVTDAQGRAGMHGHRSHDVVPLESMPLAVPALQELRLLERRWPADARITAIAPVGGDRPLVLVNGEPWAGRGPDTRPAARTSVRERAVVGGRELTWRVAGTGFWQVHREAPTLLAQAVLDAVAPVLEGRSAARLVDLYSGAGLLTLPLADAVGAGGHVVAVEGEARAVSDARRNLHEHPWVDLRQGSVEDTLRDNALGAADVVVLDPPRVGAGRRVLAEVAAMGPQRVVHVACDPASLARDVADLAASGYRLTSLRALDLFPMTHHVECVAVLDRH